MKTNRRKFLSTAGAAGLASPLFSLSSGGAERAGSGRLPDAEARQVRLLEVLRQPVLKRELFKSPVIIESVELLKWENSFLCRVRSADGCSRLGMRLNGIEEMERWVLSWTTDATVVRPKELARRIQKTAEDLGKNYR